MQSTTDYKTIKRKFDFDQPQSLFVAITHEADTLPSDTIWDVKIKIIYEIETVDSANYNDEYSDPWDWKINGKWETLQKSQPQELPPYECKNKK